MERRKEWHGLFIPKVAQRVHLPDDRPGILDFVLVYRLNDLGNFDAGYFATDVFDPRDDLVLTRL
jgi:hypothetical protein